MKEEKKRLDELNKNPEEKMAVIETTFSGYHDQLDRELKKL
jgi:N-formylglutamate amidohydrolase